MTAADACIACGGKHEYFGRRGNYTYVRCVACGTIQLSPIPASAELSRAYRDDYVHANHIALNAEHSRDATRTLHAALVAALKRHAAGSRVLDYGAGWGGLVLQLRASGFDAIGYDLSAEMVKRCQSEELPIRLGAIDDVTERDFDAIVLASVFEHINDPAEWLGKASALLKPGGLLVTTQPTALFARTVGDLVRLRIRRLPLPGLHQIFCPPWHVALYSIEGMKLLAKQAGFQLLEAGPAPQQREPGLTGIAQRVLETINRAGWKLAGLKWPFFTGHIFVFRRA